MAVVEKTPTSVETAPTNEAPRYRVSPRYGVDLEGSKVILQIALPGVKRETIKMKALKDYFTLTAQRGEILYSLDLDFGLEIEPSKSKAEYSEGLLRIEFERYNPLESAFDVKIE